MKLASQAAKAILATAVAAIGTLYVASADNVVTQHEWIAVATTALGALAFVFGVPNAPVE